MTLKNKIYTLPNCDYCNLAKSILIKEEITFEELNLGDKTIREDFMIKYPGVKTAPVILFNDVFVGGYQDLLVYLKKEMIKNENSDS